MLATLLAAAPLEDARSVTGGAVREALGHINSPGAEVIRTRAAEFGRARALIRAGTPFNYEGASGPMDYDARQTVKNRLSEYRTEGGRYLDVALYDCLVNGDLDDLEACPRQPATVTLVE